MPGKEATLRGCRDRGASRVALIVLLAAVALGFLIWKLVTRGGPALVVYCAHDSVYSEPIIRLFEERTGIRVQFVPDTEASKSLGFVQKLIAEKENPRCDVFWNNEQLGTMDLTDAGVLEAYVSPNAARIPAIYKEASGLWTGFAARMRVWIVNLDRMPATAEAVGDRLDGNLSRVGIAKPLYGTTRTHYTVLWRKWGGETVKLWHKQNKDRGIIELAGNGPVKNQVASGALDFGLTDTDDFFDAVDQKKRVGMVPFAFNDTQQAIVIPNTVALIKGSPRKEQAQQLIDFLLSEEVELLLANSKARQMPLGKVDAKKLSPQVAAFMHWVGKGYPLSELGEARAACLKWLQSEYVK